MQNTTRHHSASTVRTNVIKSLLGGYGTPVLTAFIDRGHKDGPE